MEPFDSLLAIEIARLTQEEIAAYGKIEGEDIVIKEVLDCRKRFAQMGIDYSAPPTRRGL